jgi:hypothetical protein
MVLSSSTQPLSFAGLHRSLHRNLDLKSKHLHVYRGLPNVTNTFRVKFEVDGMRVIAREAAYAK